MKLSPIHVVAALATAAALTLSGCTASPEDETTTAPESGVSGELTIFAAASLSGAFDQLAADFEAANPDVDIVPITYDGSSVLVTQINEGAEVDVFASADEKNMEKVTDAGLAEVLGGVLDHLLDQLAGGDH